MSGISITRSILVCACLAAALAGCKKAEAPPTPALDSPSSSSVATPSEAMPASEATTPVAPPSTDSEASGSAQSTANELSTKQESSAMPLPGQVNNHSTTAPEEEKK